MSRPVDLCLIEGSKYSVYVPISLCHIKSLYVNVSIFYKSSLPCLLLSLELYMNFSLWYYRNSLGFQSCSFLDDAGSSRTETFTKSKTCRSSSISGNRTASKSAACHHTSETEQTSGRTFAKARENHIGRTQSTWHHGFTYVSYTTSWSVQFQQIVVELFLRELDKRTK